MATARMLQFVEHYNNGGDIEGASKRFGCTIPSAREMLHRARRLGLTTVRFSKSLGPGSQGNTQSRAVVTAAEEERKLQAKMADYARGRCKCGLLLPCHHDENDIESRAVTNRRYRDTMIDTIAEREELIKCINEGYNRFLRKHDLVCVNNMLVPRSKANGV